MASCTKITQRIEASVCFEQAFHAADRALKTTYKAAMASLVALDDRSSQADPATVGAANALRKAQRGWLAYRDNHCAGFALQDAGGRIWSRPNASEADRGPHWRTAPVGIVGALTRMARDDAPTQCALHSLDIPGCSRWEEGHSMSILATKMCEVDSSFWAEMRFELWNRHSVDEHPGDIREMFDDPKKAGYMALLPDLRPVGFAEVSIRDYVNGCVAQPVPFLEGIQVDPAH